MSRWWKFRWYQLGGRSLAIAAEPVESANPDLACYSCPKFHKYRVYGWDNAKDGFELRKTIQSTRKLHGEEEDPLQTDWGYITATLRNHRK